MVRRKKKIASEKQKGIKRGSKILSKIEIEKLKITRMCVVECPYCYKSGSKMIMTRWHFNNCKLNPNKISEIL